MMVTILLQLETKDEQVKKMVKWVQNFKEQISDFTDSQMLKEMGTTCFFFFNGIYLQRILKKQIKATKI